MKKLSFIFCALLSLCFGKIQSQDVKLEVKKIDTRNLENIKVTLTLKNNSLRKIKYLYMSCSYDEFYLTDNADIEIMGKDCDKNIPLTVDLESKSTIRINLKLKSKSREKTNFKIGFKFTEVPEIIELDRATKSAKLKSKNIWTENIAL